MKTARLCGAMALCIVLDMALGIAWAAAQELTPEGVWLHSSKDVQVEIAPCGDRLCGRVVWLKDPEDKGGEPRRDPENPDSAQRGRLVMGMMVIRGLVRSGPRLWTNGTIYNPRDGNTYRVRVTMEDPDTLHVRAFVLLPLFGETEVWTRVPG
jgi:uncharacterized protein (DUF2147 family)